MALKVNAKVEAFGRTLDFPSAYAKVESVRADKNYVEANVVVKDQANGVVLSSEQYYFASNLEGANFIQQAYEHLKTLPEFAGAEDA